MHQSMGLTSPFYQTTVGPSTSGQQIAYASSALEVLFYPRSTPEAAVQTLQDNTSGMCKAWTPGLRWALVWFGEERVENRKAKS